VKSLVLITVLFGATQLAAAQDGPSPPAKTLQNGRSSPLRLMPGQSPRPARAALPATLPAAIPEQFAPPQEAYASFPETVDGGAPAKPSACQMRLAKLAAFKPIPMLVGPGECGATDAVILDAVILPDLAKVAVTPPATMRCSLAEEIATWVRDDIAPAALKLGAPLRGLDNFDSYECRGRNRVRGAMLSEHGRANALDVRGFRLANGTMVTLTDVNVAKDWRDLIRASACARFSTVLGPGSDGNHEEHIHVDLAERRGGYKMCEWDVREPVRAVAKTEPPAPPAADQRQAAPAAAESHTAALTESVPLPRPRPFTANADRSKWPRSATIRSPVQVRVKE
jgi:hypothetical protein